VNRNLDDDELTALLGVLHDATEGTPPARLHARLRAAAVPSHADWLGRLVLAAGTLLVFFILAAMSSAFVLAPLAPIAAIVWAMTQTV
jgi:hypothetical protein